MPSPAVPSADPFQNILRDVLDRDSSQVSTSIVAVVAVLEDLLDRFRAAILACARDENVAGFKSVVCYRYGPLTSCPHAKTDTLAERDSTLHCQRSTRTSQMPCRIWWRNTRRRTASGYSKRCSTTILFASSCRSRANIASRVGFLSVHLDGPDRKTKPTVQFHTGESVSTGSHGIQL